jgi:hypothetical protein
MSAVETAPPLVFEPVIHLATRTAAAFEVSRSRAAQPPPDSAGWPSSGVVDAAGISLVEAELRATIGGIASAERMSWLVSVEPSAFTDPAGPAPGTVHEPRDARPRLVAQVSSFNLAACPGATLSAVAAARRRGWSVALQGVGSEPGSLALLPILEPDIVKVDIAACLARGPAYAMDVAYAVGAYSEASRAVVVATGVHTDRHVESAQLFGASYGQGLLFGVPAERPSAVARPIRPLPDLRLRDQLFRRTPFHIVSDARRPVLSTKRTLVEISKQLETQIAALGRADVFLATFQDVAHWTPDTQRRYEALAHNAGLTMVFGHGLEPAPLLGVRGTALAADDPLVREWSVLAVGPYYASALVALDLGDTGPDAERRFQYVVTRDRQIVVDVARELLRSSFHERSPA